jgi:hypothetical protein
MIDGNFVFGLPAITDSNTATISTNVLDTVTAVRLFSGPDTVVLCGRFPVTAAANPTVKVDFVGADNAALTSNPVVLASTGIIATDEAGVALVSGGVVDFQVPIRGQTKAKEFYGCFVTLGGTTPDTVADAKQLYLVLTAQSNMPADRAAIPA